MFRKKSMSRGISKDMPGEIVTAQPPPPPPVMKPEPVPAPPEPIVKKAEPKPKPAAPAGLPSIIPPGTKRVLVVGKFVVMTADVESCDGVVVQGNLDGNIKAKYIEIRKGGCMRGKLECEEANVAGAFEGIELIAHHRLTLSASARVGGRTTYNKLSVQDGAVLTGELVFKPSTREKDKKSSDKKSSDKKSSERKAAEKKAAAERRAAEREAAEYATPKANGDGHASTEPEMSTPKRMPEHGVSARSSPIEGLGVPPEEGLGVER